MAAPGVLTAPAPSMAIPFETPSAGGVGSAPMMSGKSAQATKKQDHLIAGRRRLEEFKQKKKREKASSANSAPDSLAQVSESDHGSRSSLQSNGEFGATRGSNTFHPEATSAEAAFNQAPELQTRQDATSEVNSSRQLSESEGQNLEGVPAAQDVGNYAPNSSALSSFLDASFVHSAIKPGPSQASDVHLEALDSQRPSNYREKREDQSTYLDYPKHLQSIQIKQSKSSQRHPEKQEEDQPIPKHLQSVQTKQSKSSQRQLEKQEEDQPMQLDSKPSHFVQTHSTYSSDLAFLDKPPNSQPTGSFFQPVSIPTHTLFKPFPNSSSEANDFTIQASNSLSSMPFSSVANGNSLLRPFEAHSSPVTAKYDQDGQDIEPAIPFQKESLDGIALNQSSSTKDEFAALEQHIEDLTQDKFSLQRGLEATRALVESLSQENSALTEDYNQQGATINELKAELERYQERFRANEVLLKTLKAEKERAQQESKSATERSRALAAEVIDLEERVLKTRSQELKLQKEVESMVAEIGSYRKQISSLEKDRSNFRTMIEALQEEKKVLLVRLREAANKANVANNSQVDASTSTDDFVVEVLPVATHDSLSMDDTSLMLHRGQHSEAIPSTSASTSSLTFSASIPADQLSMIESINVLVTELGQEKEALLKALRMEFTAVAELKAENAELLQKLERQTQQLELAVAQNMARAGSSTSPSFPQTAQAEPEFVDEGDEVVDRVLQWIMKLFPGGSSKHGGSKQL